MELSPEFENIIVRDLKYLKEYDIVRNFRCVDDVAMEAHYEAMPELMSLILNNKELYLELVDKYGY